MSIWDFVLIWVGGVLLGLLSLGFVLPLRIKDPITASGAVGFRFAIALVWPIAIFVLGFCGAVAALAHFSRYTVECPSCEGSPFSEGIGGREAKCNRCKGKGEVNVTWKQLKEMGLTIPFNI